MPTVAESLAKKAESGELTPAATVRLRSSFTLPQREMALQLAVTTITKTYGYENKTAPADEVVKAADKFLDFLVGTDTSTVGE
jgi:hypothetical protein